MSKYTLPRCPYCNEECQRWDVLSKLATEGWSQESDVYCTKCGKKYIIRIHINYYAKRIKSDL